MSKFARFALLVLVVATLSACGAKGPLFLPEKPMPVEDVPAPVPAEAAPAETAPASDASDAVEPAEPPIEVPAAPPVNGNG